MKPTKDHSSSWRTLMALSFGMVLLVLARNAWVSDDAYITFRTAANFLGGHGLRFNVAERVQTYTNPLWLFLTVIWSGLSGEYFFTTMIASMCLSMTAVVLTATRVAISRWGVLFALVVFVSSKSFVDYSTSGMENPALHLLTVLGAIILLLEPPSPRRLLGFTLVASAATLARPDAILLFLPAIALAAWRLGLRRAALPVLIGLTPVLAWEAFSLLYYGFFFPNTAYAKLNVDAPRLVKLKQGCAYLMNSLNWDPITLFTIGAGIALPFRARQWRVASLGAGIVLYLTYVVYIGADHMSGRFLSAPLVAAVICVLAMDPFPRLETTGWLALGVFTLVGAAGSAAPMLTRAPADDSPPERVLMVNQITDEREYWFVGAGFMQVRFDRDLPDNAHLRDGRAARDRGERLAVVDALGYFAFAAGPSVHVIDRFALADPLLARIPALEYQPSHNERPMPDGYRETLLDGRNRIADPYLARYYDALADITRGPIWHSQRLAEIWRFNAGRYDHLMVAYALRSQASKERIGSR